MLACDICAKLDKAVEGKQYDLTVVPTLGGEDVLRGSAVLCPEHWSQWKQQVHDACSLGCGGENHMSLVRSGKPFKK